jgi:disulfide bond formation protein DsbB
MSNNPSSAPASSLLTWLALLAALVGTAGSVYLSVGLNYKACPLCYYQRTFMMAIFGVLAIGLLGGMGRTVSLSTLCLPLAVAGAAVAGKHTFLEASKQMECPGGVFALGSAPQQSAAIYLVLTLLLLSDAASDALNKRRLGGSLLALLVAVLLGVGFQEVSFRSAQPAYPPPAEEYQNTSPTICRKPAS